MKKFSKEDLLLDLLLIKNITNKVYVPIINDSSADSTLLLLDEIYAPINIKDLPAESTLLNIKDSPAESTLLLSDEIVKKEREVFNKKIGDTLRERLSRYFQIGERDRPFENRFEKSLNIINTTFTDEFIMYELARVNLLYLVSAINNNRKLDVHLSSYRVGGLWGTYKDNITLSEVTTNSFNSSGFRAHLPKTKYWRKMRMLIVKEEVKKYKKLLDAISQEELEEFSKINNNNWFNFFKETKGYKFDSLSKNNVLDVVWKRYFRESLGDNSNIHKLLKKVSLSDHCEFMDKVMNTYIEYTVEYMLKEQTLMREKSKGLIKEKTLSVYTNDEFNNIMGVIETYIDKTTKYIGDRKYKIYLETKEEDVKSLRTKNSVVKVHKLIFKDYRTDGESLTDSHFRYEFHFKQRVSGDIVFSEYHVFKDTSRKRAIKSQIVKGSIENADAMEEVINKCIDERIKRVLDDNEPYVGILSTKNNNTFVNRVNGYFYFKNRK